jgi:peptidoglycan/LPS O-acetylase OafA/YrhL
LRDCGKYSFGIYVFHQLIHQRLGEPWMLARFGGHPPAHAVYLYSATIGVISFGAAFLSYHLLEKHFLALRNRLAPRFSRPGTAEIQ